MNKKKFSMLIMLFIMIFPIMVVNATETDYVFNGIRINFDGKKKTDGIKFKAETGSVHVQSYFASDIKVDQFVNGNNVKKCYETQGAFCLTPGASNTKDAYKCRFLDPNSDYDKKIDMLLNYYEPGYNNSNETEQQKKIKAMSLRMLAGVEEGGTCGKNNKKCKSILKGYKKYYNNEDASDYFYAGYENSQDLKDAKARVEYAENNYQNYTMSGKGYYCVGEQNTTAVQQFAVKIVEKTCDDVCSIAPSETFQNKVTGNLNNCCEADQTTHLSEANIDDLFYDDDCIGATKFLVKNGVNRSEYAKEVNRFCALYCTENIVIKQPGSFNIANEHYFKTNTVEYKGRTFESPVVDGYSNCRLKIEFDVWSKEYSAAVQSTIEAFNDYLMAKAEYESFSDIVSESERVATLNSTCSIQGYLGNDLYYGATCPNYTSATQVNPSCVPNKELQYVPCEAGYSVQGDRCVIDNPTGIIDNQYVHGCEDKAGKTYEIKNNLCVYSYPRTQQMVATSYSCPDSQRPTISSETYKAFATTDTISKNISLNEKKYTFGSNTYTYRPLDGTIGGTYTAKNGVIVPIYNSMNITSSVVTVPTKNSFYVYSKDGVEVSTKTYVDEINSFYNTYNDKTIGSVKCMNGQVMSYKATCTKNTDTEIHESKKVNVENERKIREVTLEQAKSSYEIAVKNLESLVSMINDCNNYFTTGKGADPNNYKFEPELDFVYTQKYLDNSGKTAEDRVKVSYTRVCEPQPVVIGNVGTSKAYGTSAISYKMFKNDLSQYDGYNTSSIVTNVYMEPIFTRDASYNTLCHWVANDEENVITLVGNGTSIKSIENKDTFITITQGLFSYNYVDFNHHTTTEKGFSGKFQTYATLTNLGANGKFEKYITDQTNKGGNSNACFVDESIPNSSFTCTYTAVDVESSYGGCDSELKKCKPEEEKLFYSFKVVDTNTIFPKCSNTSTKAQKEACFDSLGYGYNWLMHESGQQVMDEMQNSNIYDIDKKTYSFRLTSQTMKEIQEYNKSRKQYGGYKDSNLNCVEKCKSPLTIDTEVNMTEILREYFGNDEHFEYIGEKEILNSIQKYQTNTVLYTDSCSKCLSNFLTDLGNNKVNGKTIQGIWNRGNVKIEDIRKKLTW